MIPFVSLLTRECLFLLFASVFILLAMSAIYVDVYFMDNALHENSVTEILQEIILAGIAVLFFWCATKRPEIRGGLILIGGFYLCMLIRELDDIFDMIRHGSWLWFALTTAVVCIALSALIPASTVTGLTDFIQHRSWLMTAMGLIIILIFSRIFGMNQLWSILCLTGITGKLKIWRKKRLNYWDTAYAFSPQRFIWEKRVKNSLLFGKAGPDTDQRGLSF